jgi:hypothetical protein
MKRIIILVVLALFAVNLGYAQDEAKPEKKKDRPVSEMWSGSLMIDEQTTFIPYKKSLEMQIQHRFGLIKNNGISDLFGIYASANTRMGLNYSILDNLAVGYGITRKNMYSDFSVKWDILRQTRKNVVPVDVAVYANMAIDGRDKEVFNTATADSTFKFTNRLSYFTQLMVSRKFTDWFSLAVNGSFTHYNSVKADSVNIKGMDHDRIGIGIMGRFKFSPQSSIVISYSMPLYIHQISENHEVTNRALPNFSVAYEVQTATHVFQIFFTTAGGILPQDNYLYNSDDWTKGEFRFGFNIQRLWEF